MKLTLNPAFATTLVAIPLLVGCHQGSTAPASDANQEQAQATSPAATAPDNAYVTLHGTVVNARPHGFDLDYGSGTILVEMDDYDFYPEGRLLMEDDRVVVYGYVDDDFYEARSIEASSVYVKNLGTQFYASGIDEEAFPLVAIEATDPTIEVSGKIDQINGREFTLVSQGSELKVDTSDMLYNPLDEEGFQQLSEGDRVRVTGQLDNDLFDQFELDARVIISVESSDS